MSLLAEQRSTQPFKPKTSISDVSSLTRSANLSERQLKEKKEAEVAYNLFWALSRYWGLSLTEQKTLLQDDNAFSFTPKPSKTPTKSTLARIAAILTVNECLNNLFAGNMQEIQTWLKTPNELPIFAQKPPLDILCSESIQDVRALATHLEGVWESLV